MRAPQGRADRWSAALPPSAAIPDARTAPCAVQPTVGRLPFLPTPQYLMDAPRLARCSRPTVGSTGLFVSADDQHPPICPCRPVVGTHRVVRVGSRRNADPPGVEPTVGRLPFLPTPQYLMDAPRLARCSRPTVGSTGLFVPADDQHPPICPCRPVVGAHRVVRVGSRRNADPPGVEPTVGRLPFLPTPQYLMDAPRLARCSRPTVGSTGLFVPADDQHPPVCTRRPVVGTHRVVRDTPWPAADAMRGAHR